MRTRLILEIVCVNMLLAVSVNLVSAACLTPPASLQTISQFRLAPVDLVAPNSDTRAIEATTRDLAGTDASLAADLVRIARGTNPRYQTAIAAGLALAAISCSTVDQKAAQLIQEAAASFQDGQFQASFAAVSGDSNPIHLDPLAARRSLAGGAVVHGIHALLWALDSWSAPLGDQVGHWIEFETSAPTDLSLHPHSPGYRLILNNVLFPAAKQKHLKT